MPLYTCKYCNKEFRSRDKKSYCCPKHYTEYRRAFPELFKRGPQKTPTKVKKEWVQEAGLRKIEAQSLGVILEKLGVKELPRYTNRKSITLKWTERAAPEIKRVR